MSANAAIFNPTETTSAATGDGFSVPRLTTTGRLAITFGTGDKGMMVYDTTLNNLFIWTGSAWESVPASGDAGANGAVQYNDNGVVSGATQFFYDKTNNRVGIGTTSPTVPLDVVGSGDGELRLRAGSDTSLILSETTANKNWKIKPSSGDLYFQYSATGYNTGYSSLMSLTTSGNLGLGVTPSAWGGSYKAFQIANAARSLAATGAGSGDLTLAFNAVYDATDSRWEYTATGDKAGRYSQTGAGDHVWYNTNTAGTAGNPIAFMQALTLNANGALALQGGNTSANGVGIAFPATQVASTDANTLDDYEEGTWTPTIQGNTTPGAGTYVVQVGVYTKVGNQVTVWAQVEWSAHTGTGTQMYLSGLPFAVRVLSNYTVAATIGYFNNIALTAGNFPLIQAGNSDNFARFFQSPTGGGSASAVPMDTTGHVVISMTYQT